MSDIPDLLEDYIDLKDDIFNSNLEALDNISPDTAYTSLNSTQLTRTTGVEIDLYDVGATCHMSGFHHKFINFVETEPVPITAVAHQY
ncbi:hypothetical protein BYT27DRAFT_7120127 [Phlegmacium glaucopus]|nr:hypothetical protein BYT27DRAFT_7120127 [Phlegmacium glaucopus]